MKKVSVRNMTPDDWERVAEIYQQGIEKNRSTFVREVPSYQTWDEAHIASCRLVAEVDGVAAGWTVLTPTSPRSCFSGVAEVSIYIDDAYQKNGIGTALLERMIRESENEGFWTLYSSIFIENTGSRKLHEKCGFRMIGMREKIAKDRSGNWRDTVIYEKRSKLM